MHFCKDFIILTTNSSKKKDKSRFLNKIQRMKAQVNKMAHHIMYNCKQTSRMVSDSMDMRLPLHQRIRIKLHLYMCKLCNNNYKQLRIIKQLTQFKANNRDQGSCKLSTDASDRIKKKLSDEFRKKNEKNVRNRKTHRLSD